MENVIDLPRRKLALSGLIVFCFGARTYGAEPPTLAEPKGSHTALGDLSRFRAIAVDTLRIAQTGDLHAARARIRDLEESWEDAAPKMKSLAPDKWKAIDSAIDRARRELRFWRAKRTDSVEALQSLIDTMDTVG
jgi:hypothetical protein